MKNDALYIKMEQNIQVSNTKIFLQDIAKLYSTDKNMVSKLNKEVFMTIKSKEDTKYMVSILKIIELIGKDYPSVEIVNLGETDVVISYVVPKPKQKYLEYIKTGFVCLIIFFGAAFSIMTFNTDVSVSDVFDKSYELVLGKGIKGNGMLEIAYSIGLPVGIIIFFNHFSRFKIHSDPTPLQIEMRTYEEEVNKALIKNASREGKTMDAN